MDPLLLARWQFGITTVYHFLFVPLTISLAFIGRRPADGLVPDRQREVPAPDPVLREALPHQLRARRRHRHRPGVPVRDELERLQPLRRRHLRGAARDRGPARLLPRVDVPRPLDLRLGPPLEAGPPCDDLDRRRSARSSRPTSSWPPTRGCSTRSATRSTRPPGGPSSIDIVAVLTSPVALITFAHTIPAAFMTGGAFVAGVAMWRLAPPSRHRPGCLPHGGEGRRLDARGVRPPRRRHRRRPGPDHDRRPADEDGRRRGALGDDRLGRVLSLFTIGTLDGSEEIFSIRIPYLLSFMATGDSTGTVEGINDLQAQYEAAVRPGRLDAEHPGRLLGASA